MLTQKYEYFNESRNFKIEVNEWTDYDGKSYRLERANDYNDNSWS